MSDTYGSYATLLRYPFDYSGSAMDMFNRFRNFENETAAQSQIMKQTGGREGASPGLIGGSKFSKPLEGWQKSGIDPVFFQSWMGPPETPIIGHPGQKVLEPLFTQTKPIIKEMEAEETALKKLYAEGKYEELINKLNDKIKSGDFGSPESNIEQIKIRQKEKSDVAPYIDLSKYDIYKGASKPYQSEHIDPQTGLISLEGDGLENIASDALSSYQAFMDFGPLLDAARNKSNIVRTYYSPLKFKFKEGGELPKARFGKPVKLPERNEREYLHHSRYKFPSLQNRTIPAFKIDPQFSQSYWNTWNNLPQGGFHKNIIPTKPKLDQATRDLLRYPEFDVLTGETELGSPTELTKYLGDFDSKAFSDGWQVRNDMMNAFDKPQWVPGKEDFFTNKEIENLFNQHLKFRDAARSFNEMYPEDPGTAVFNALTGNKRRDELFSNLYPNVGLPNFRSKILSTEQEKNINLWLNRYSKDVSSPSFINKSKLNPQALKTINTGFETLPKAYQQLLESQKGNDFLQTGPAKVIVAEMRGSLGLSLEEVLNASPEQLEIWRRQIVIKMGKQDLEKWNRDIEKPFKGSDAWRQLSSEPGYKNKMGGISMKLSKSEIDKYVKGGYIIEEE